MSQGWIKLHRQLRDNPLWRNESFTRGQAWVDLLLLANHKEGWLFVRGNKIVVPRGFVGWSETSLAREWRWSRDKVRRFLSMLETAGQIRQQKSNVLGLIEVLNYDQYQLNDTTDDTTDRQQTIQQTDTNKNEKKNKNDKTTGIEKEILDELRRYETVSNPSAYLSALQRKASPEAIRKAWSEWKRGSGIESPADFYARCVHWSR